MMSVKEADEMVQLLKKFRENGEAWKKLKCLDSVSLKFHTGWTDTHHTSSSKILALVQAALLDDKKKELREQRDQLHALGVDASSEMPDGLR